MDLFKNCRTQEEVLQMLLPRVDICTGAVRDTWSNVMGVRVVCYSQQEKKLRDMTSQQRINASTSKDPKMDKVVLKLVLPDAPATKLSTITTGDALKEWIDRRNDCCSQLGGAYMRHRAKESGSGLSWDDRGSGRRLGDNLLEKDITKLTAGLGIFRMLPSRCLDMKMRDLTNHAMRLNQQSMVLGGERNTGNFGITSAFPMLRLTVQSKMTAWTCLLDGCHVSWLIDSETGKIYVDAPHWKMAETKAASKKNSRLKELRSSADLFYAQQQGILPPSWCPTYFLRNFRQALNQIVTSQATTKRSAAASILNRGTMQASSDCDYNACTPAAVIDPSTGKVSLSSIYLPETKFETN